MKITLKKSTLINAAWTVTVTCVVLTVIIILRRSHSAEPDLSNVSNREVTLTGNEQVLNVAAKGGYTPRVVQAKAGENAALVISTNSTFDCSTAFTIPSLGIRRSLPFNGETKIGLPAQPAGTELEAMCSMGMYKFVIKYT